MKKTPETRAKTIAKTKWKTIATLIATAIANIITTSTTAMISMKIAMASSEEKRTATTINSEENIEDNDEYCAVNEADDKGVKTTTQSE